MHLDSIVNVFCYEQASFQIVAPCNRLPTVPTLLAAFGGSVVNDVIDFVTGGPTDKNFQDCINHHQRNIYGGNGFPNCAATVDDGSHCSSNDACYSKAVDYQMMHDCSKAWR